MIDYKSLMEKAEEEMLYQKPSTEGLVRRKPTTHHAILKDDAGNYVRVSYSGRSLIHANS